MSKSPISTSGAPVVRISIPDVITCDEGYGAAYQSPASILGCCTLSYSNDQWHLTTTKANVVIDNVARASGFSLSWAYNADITHTIKAP